MEIIVLVRGDITVALSVNRLIRERSIDTIIHFATESLLDRSITGPAAFINTNIVGTYTLLEAARTAWLSERKRDDARFHHVSTDEDFGRLSEAICHAVRRRHIRPAHRTRPARQAPITSPARIITRLGYWPR